MGEVDISLGEFQQFSWSQSMPAVTLDRVGYSILIAILPTFRG
jgi:hypothetical protein